MPACARAVTSASRSAQWAPHWSSITVVVHALRKPKHRLGEITTPRRINPTSTEDQMPVPALMEVVVGLVHRIRSKAQSYRSRPTGGHRHQRRSQCCSAPARRRALRPLRDGAGVVAFSNRAKSVSLSALSTAVWAAALTMMSGRNARTVSATPAGFEKSPQWSVLSKSNAVTEPSTDRLRCNPSRPDHLYQKAFLLTDTLFLL